MSDVIAHRLACHKCGINIIALAIIIILLSLSYHYHYHYHIINQEIFARDYGYVNYAPILSANHAEIDYSLNMYFQS